RSPKDSRYGWMRNGGHVNTARLVAEVVATPAMPAAGALINLGMTAFLTIALLLSLVRARPLD
ncbi:MAG: hypothetical protein ACOYM5_07790, partial [Caulobacter sp.]